MCDIGHHTLLFDLKRWQIYAALRGIDRKNRTAWETTRMLGYWYACGHRSRNDPKIDITEILQFPWEDNFSYNDDDDDDDFNEEDAEYCQQLIAAENKK